MEQFIVLDPGGGNYGPVSKDDLKVWGQEGRLFAHYTIRSLATGDEVSGDKWETLFNTPAEVPLTAPPVAPPVAPAAPPLRPTQPAAPEQVQNPYAHQPLQQTPTFQPVQPAPQRAAKSKTSPAVIIFIVLGVFCLGIVGVAGVVGMIGMGAAQGAAQETLDLSNAKQVGTAVLMFANDSSDHLPILTNAAQIKTSIGPYLKSPDLEKAAEGYTWNSAISGAALTQMVDPGAVWLFKSSSPNSSGNVVIGYCDGHASLADKTKLESVLAQPVLTEPGTQPPAVNENTSGQDHVSNLNVSEAHFTWVAPLGWKVLPPRGKEVYQYATQERSSGDPAIIQVLDINSSASFDDAVAGVKEGAKQDGKVSEETRDKTPDGFDVAYFTTDEGDAKIATALIDLGKSKLVFNYIDHPKNFDLSVIPVVVANFKAN